LIILHSIRNQHST